MTTGRIKGPRRAARALAGTALTVGALAGMSVPAQAATTASFSNGVLTVNGDNSANSIVMSRDAVGKILVNGGAVVVKNGTPTVANTTLIRASGLKGADVITLNQALGALPAANLNGGAGNDTLTGGAGNDQLFGQGNDDTLIGVGGFDLLFGGSENDTITGGDADDQAFGQSGNDRMIWNPGDDTDLNEGGDGTDTIQVNGGNGAEQFTTTANGTRVRFDRLSPAPFSLDIGTSEELVLLANGGDDSSSATGNLAALIKMTVDGGTGVDTILGSNGADVLTGGDGDDFVDGQQGNDIASLGLGTDTFQWDPGDGSDTVEGQGDSDTLLFNGSNGDENMAASANGGRVRFTRNLGTIVMDLDDVESIVAKTFGGVDNVTVNDLSGTDVVDVVADLAAAAGGDDLAADNVTAVGTNGDDVAVLAGAGPSAGIFGLAAQISVSGGIASTDRITVNAMDGDDVVDASAMQVTAVPVTLDGGIGSDVLIGGDNDDALFGGDGDDVLIGGPGIDILDGQADDDVVIQLVGSSTDAVKSATAVGKGWLKKHAHAVGGKSALDVGGKERVLPRADLV